VKYAQFWPVLTYISIFVACESNILGKSLKISSLKNIKTSPTKKQRLRRKP
jgi:lipoprotein